MFCGVDFYAPKHRKRKYCSAKCFSSACSKRDVKIVCAQCSKTSFKKLSAMKNSIHRVFFCSRRCKDLGQSFEGLCSEIRPAHYTTGRASYRERALRKHSAICNRCGYKELEVMLDVHHKDGNRKHNVVENLEVLCVWCHALYTRKVLGSSPNWHGTALAMRNNVDSTSTGSTNIV
jgi:hypothetical protein